MRLELKSVPLLIVTFIAGVVIGIGLRGCSSDGIEPSDPIILHDTISFHDTLRIEGKTRTIKTVDSVFVLYRDTIKDTIYLPFDTKIYSDSIVTDTSRISWSVKYSGFKAKIDSFGLYYDFTVQPRTVVKKNGWGQFVGVAVGAGYGVSVIDKNQVYAAPTLSVSLVYGWGYHFDNRRNLK